MSEKEIIAHFKQGNNLAYKELYTKYFGMVQYLVLKNSGSSTEADDVFQDTAVILFEKVRQDEFKLTSTLKTFVYSIARNIWFMELRKKKKENRFRDFENLERVDTDELINEEDLNERQRNIVTACLEKLGEPCKTLLVKFYYFRESMIDIAEYFKDNQPCRTTCEINCLPTPIGIELKCIATIDE